MTDAAPDALGHVVVSGPSQIHGTGCFARVPLATGEFIATFTGPVVAADGEHVLWATRDGRHWQGRLGTSLLRYLNHSDTPNAAFEEFDLYAIAAIAAGQEITIDYQP
jgi:SET domain-containing protein